MNKQSIRKAGRRKAPFGSQEAAILAAAGINASTQLVAAARNASATKDAARKSAQATVEAANKNAAALKEQNEKSVELQQQSQDFVKAQNEENRDLQKDIQLQLQMLTGQQNETDRLEASKIVVRNGGKTTNKSASSGFLLQGSNMPFRVTDGGGLIHRGSTPEGYDLYELYGNDHEHYHKAQGGRYKSGVGIKFADGNVVEGEGNQNGSKGELMLTTPDNAYFISKHTIKGFNPADNVKEGMDPMVAYKIQETLKQLNGISDDGKHHSPVKKMNGGVSPIDIAMQVDPMLGGEIIAPVSVGVAYTNNNKMKCGGMSNRSIRLSGRRKAYTGLSLNDRPITRMYTIPNLDPKLRITLSANNNGGGQTKSKFSISKNADLIGAGIGGVANIVGGFLTSSANNKAARITADANARAAGIMKDAYNSLTGIDLNSIKRDDYKAAHAMAAIQAPTDHTLNPVTRIDRSLQRSLRNAGRYSASSAAAQERMRRAELDAIDAKNNVYAEDAKRREEIIQNNLQRIQAASEKNAELDSQANREHTAAYLDALKFNANIENQKALGAAGAEADAITNSASAESQAATANGMAWGQALGATGQGFAQGLTSMANRELSRQAIMLGADGDARASYYANPKLTSMNDARNEYNSLKAQYDTLNSSQKNSDYGKGILRKINIIANSRGFDIV